MKDSRTLFIHSKLHEAIQYLESAQDAIEELVRGEYADLADDSIALGNVLESLNGSLDAL